MNKIPFSAFILRPIVSIIINNKSFVYHRCEEIDVNLPGQAFNLLNILIRDIDYSHLPMELKALLDELMQYPLIEYEISKKNRFSLVGSLETDVGIFYGTNFRIKSIDGKNVLYYDFKINNKKIEERFELNTYDSIILISNILVNYAFPYFIRADKLKLEFNSYYPEIEDLIPYTNYDTKLIRKIIFNDKRINFNSDQNILHILEYANNFVNFLRMELQHNEISYEKILYLNGHGLISLLFKDISNAFFKNVNHILLNQEITESIYVCYLSQLQLLKYNGLLPIEMIRKVVNEIYELDKSLLRTTEKNLKGNLEAFSLEI
ncbi:MAG: hypothetical protein INQ03_14390 [Candidatus Heimdallarchaeota archaeon]|nr:hypothetical protein [Candidatus Heimdallarchaeota archaeon]